MTGDQITAGLLDTFDGAIYLLGWIALFYLISRVMRWWTFDVKRWWHNHRFGLRFDLVEPKNEAEIPFRFEE